MTEQKFSIGAKVRVKRFKAGTIHSDCASRKVGKVGKVLDFDGEYQFPYNLEFDDGSELMFMESELEEVK